MVVHYPKNRSLFSFYSPHSCPTKTFQPLLHWTWWFCVVHQDRWKYNPQKNSQPKKKQKKNNHENSPHPTSPSPHPPANKQSHPYFSFRLIYWPTPQTLKCFAPEETGDSSTRPAETAGEQQVHQALHEADTHGTTSRRHTLESSPLSSTRITWNHSLASSACIKTQTDNKISNSVGQIHQYF